jgi:hypothetical protein
VPDGDEYDKDIALEYRYAVDNGESNRKFRKSFLTNNGCMMPLNMLKRKMLIVHAAGMMQRY